MCLWVCIIPTLYNLEVLTGQSAFRTLNIDVAIFWELQFPEKSQVSPQNSSSMFSSPFSHGVEQMFADTGAFQENLDSLDEEEQVNGCWMCKQFTYCFCLFIHKPVGIALSSSVTDTSLYISLY